MVRQAAVLAEFFPPAAGFVPTPVFFPAAGFVWVPVLLPAAVFLPVSASFLSRTGVPDGLVLSGVVGTSDLGVFSGLDVASFTTSVDGSTNSFFCCTASVFTSAVSSSFTAVSFVVEFLASTAFSVGVVIFAAASVVTGAVVVGGLMTEVMAPRSPMRAWIPWIVAVWRCMPTAGQSWMGLKGSIDRNCVLPGSPLQSYPRSAKTLYTGETRSTTGFTAGRRGAGTADVIRSMIGRLLAGIM